MDGYSFTYQAPAYLDYHSKCHRQAIEALWDSFPESLDVQAVKCDVAGNGALGRFHITVPKDSFVILTNLGHKLTGKTIKARGCIFIDLSVVEDFEKECGSERVAWFAKHRVFFVSKIAQGAAGQVDLDVSSGTCSINQFQVFIPPMSEEIEYCLYRKRGVGIISSFVWNSMVFVSKEQAVTFFSDIRSFFQVVDYVSIFKGSRDSFSTYCEIEKLEYRKTADSIVDEVNSFVLGSLMKEIQVLEAAEKEGVAAGFSSALSKQEKVKRFPEWSRFTDWQDFLSSLNWFADVFRNHKSELQWLVYMAVYINILKKSQSVTGVLTPQNMTYQLRCRLEDAGVDNAFFQLIEQFDEHFKGRGVEKHYRDTTGELGSRFAQLTSYVIRYINYLVAKGGSHLTTQLNDLLAFLGAVENQDVNYFMGAAISAYFEGETDSIKWPFKKMNAQEFNVYMEEGKGDYDTLLIRGVVDKIYSLSEVFRFFLGGVSPSSDFLQSLSLYTDRFDNDEVSDNNLDGDFLRRFSTSVLDREHGCHSVKKKLLPLFFLHEDGCKRSLFMFSLIESFMLCSMESEPLDKLILFLLKEGYGRIVDDISGYVSFHESR